MSKKYYLIYDPEYKPKYGETCIGVYSGWGEAAYPATSVWPAKLFWYDGEFGMQPVSMHLGDLATGTITEEK